MKRRLHILFGILIIAAYGFVDYRGLDIAPHKKQFIPHGLRSAAHGGYRSYWYGGFHGGK